MDQQQLLEQAKQAAHSWNFNEAQNYLERAQQKAYSPNAIAQVERVIREERDAYRAKKEADQAEKNAQQELAGSGSRLNCSSFSGNSDLFQYCQYDSCSGFVGNYPLYNLCKHDETIQFNNNYKIYSYLKNSNVLDFSGGNEQLGAKEYSNSFTDRKRFVIYYLNGYVLRKK
ncbi:MAG: hypothetical protein HWE24_18055 [Oceanospirillaceae bacterium]|nr:hypothetical protein [Oceanospirillaceae bacterium]